MINPLVLQGKEGNPPRAGCPKGNLRRTVSDLVEGAGLSVVVCEEAPEPYSYGTSRKSPKQRYVAAVVTPAAPHFLHGMVDEEINIPVEQTPPLLGISPSVGGYSIIEVDAELLTVRVTEGLTEDAVYSRLHEGGLVPPLYLHTPTVSIDAETRLKESIPEVEWKQRMGALFRTQGTSFVRYNDPDPVRGMLDRIKMHLGMSTDTEFRHLPSASPTTRPRPLYFSTASNLGLHKTRGVPSLLDYVLPARAPLASRRWLRSLLLMPPAPATAVAIHAACREMLMDHDATPDFVSMSPANVVLKLRNKEGNDVFFNELRDLCKVVMFSCSSSTLSKMSDNLLEIVYSDAGILLSRGELKSSCSSVIDAIKEVVISDSEYLSSKSEQENAKLLERDSDPNMLPVLRMKEQNESFVGKVQPDRISDVMKQVHNAWNRLRIEAMACLDIAKETIDDETETQKKSSPYLSYDVNNNAVWVRMGRGNKITSLQASTLGLEHPKDRNGKVSSDTLMCFLGRVQRHFVFYKF